jgi:hypothetical protein
VCLVGIVGLVHCGCNGDNGAHWAAFAHSRIRRWDEHFADLAVVSAHWCTPTPALSASNWTAALPRVKCLAPLETEDVVNSEVVQFRKRPAADFLGFVGGHAINAQKVFRQVVGGLGVVALGLVKQ